MADDNDPTVLLLVEDDIGLRTQLKWAFSEQYRVELAADRQEAMQLVRAEEPSVVLLDLGLPPDPNGVSEGFLALQEIIAFRPDTKVIVSSGNTGLSNAMQAIRLGAYDFYPKPVDIDVLRLIAQRAAYLQSLEAEIRLLALRGGRKDPLAGVVGASEAMLEICRIIEKVASSEVRVLLLGESGTGKEVLARALHAASDRRQKRFVAINCAAIPDALLESELFGHERGAFTGAVKQTIGKIEHASGGTLFLDEIGDMPAGLQAKLLRFLQEGVIERVGGHTNIAVNVRVVAATNQNLAQMIAEGRFREDLYYRLNEIELSIPPLRDRPGDAVVLARHFIERFHASKDAPVPRLSPDAVGAISAYHWPGNVRELENKIKRALALASGNAITAADLALSLTRYPTLREVREQAEREAIAAALNLSDGNVSAAAKLLGISRPTLYDLIKGLGIR